MHKINLTFEWKSCSADPNQYSQQMQLLEPISIHIVVKLDADPKYFENKEVSDYHEARLLHEIGTGKAPVLSEFAPILLTPEGAAKARDLLQEAFFDKHPYAENNSDDWDEDEVIKE